MESREIKEIRGTKCLKTRKIWEEVFWEDSKKFTDYYFEEKAEDNIGYIIGEKEIRAMMFRTPYEAVVYGKKCFLSYIVGVATKEQFRHQGLMTALLKESFGKMYHEKEPFTFLMPANPAIYEPFDFTYVYSKDIWGLKKGYDFTCLEDLWYNNELCAAERADEKKRHLISLKNLVGDNFENKIFDRIANFANSLLEKKYEIYLVRDKKYYQRQKRNKVCSK